MKQTMISAVIPARNEAHRLGACLASLRGLADEAVIVDDGSTDDTVAAAQRLGARVIRRDRRGRSIEWLMRQGLEVCDGRWALLIDADEHMTPTLAARLKDTVAADHYSGVRYARRNMMFGRWARYGGWFNADQLRFFRSDAWDRGWTCQLHCMPPVRGEVLNLPTREDLATVHWDYESVPQFVRRSLLNYAQIEAQHLYETGRRFSPLCLLAKPAKRFAGRYLVRQGFRDGTTGLILAAMLAAYDFCIEAFLWDLQRKAAS